MEIDEKKNPKTATYTYHYRVLSYFELKSRSDLNKENRVVATVVGRYGIYGTSL